MDQPSPAIEFSRVSRSFDGARVLHDLDLSVASGSFTALVGASGSGKTTTLKLVNRLITADSGVVRVEGEAIDALPAPALRRRIGYVFQGIGLFPHLSVAENIGITPKLLGWERARLAARVDELLRLVALPTDYAARAPAALSGGERQRVGVARALAAGARIMLMDEPMGALDPVTRDRLGRDYRALHANLGLTTLMVTHDIQEALLLADRVIVMAAGRIIADASPRALLGGGAAPQAQALLDVAARQAGEIAAMRGGGDRG